MTVLVGFWPEISDTLQQQEGLLFQIFRIFPVQLLGTAHSTLKHLAQMA